MRHRDHHVAFDGGTYHSGELELQTTLLLFAQREGRADLAYQLLSVAQEEVQQVKHDEDADDKVEGALPETECLRRQVLTALHRALGDLVA